MIFSFVLIKTAINGLPDGEAHWKIASETGTKNVAIFLLFIKAIGGIRHGDVVAFGHQLADVAKVIADELPEGLVIPE